MEFQALPLKGQCSVSATRLSARIIARLVQAEACELNPHLRDDLRIAKLTVLYAARGEAVLCSPHVLASYAVLGLHPDKVWPAIEERREALGINQQFAGWKLPPKKPPLPAALRSQEKSCPEKTNGARAVNSRAGTTLLCDNTSSVPMTAAPSIIAGYPNSDAPSSVEKGAYSYEELFVVIAASGAPQHVRQVTLDALAVRGPWPKAQGPVTPIISVSITSLQDKATVWRSTIQRRIQRAKKDQYWREIRGMNSWLDCPKCGAKRESAQCPKCPHKGNGFDPKEFRRTFTYAIDVGKFERTPPCRQVRQIRELRARHSSQSVARMPERKPAAGEERKPLPVTRDVRLAIASAYSNARKQGKDDEAAIAEASKSLSSERYSLAPSEVRLQLKIWQSKHGSLSPPAREERIGPVKCPDCQSVLVQNRGPGPRLICLKCSEVPKDTS